MFASIKSQTSVEMGHVGSKIRSLGQIFEKPCAHSRGQIVSHMLMKLGQNVSFNDIPGKFENESSVKN